MLIKFKSMSRPIQLARGLKLLPHLMRVFAGWPYREVPKAGNSGALLNVLYDNGTFVLEAPWLKKQLHHGDAAELAHALSTHVARGWFLEHSGMLWLEAAAVVFGDQIVVFVGGPRSGKSLLAACMAVNGHKVFADSILPVWVEEPRGISLGMAPRLQLPLPAELRGPPRGLIEDQLDSGSEKYGYLSPGEGNMTKFGQTARIRAFVMLDRSASSTATVGPASSGKLLKRLLLNGFGEGMSGDELLRNVRRVVDDVPCFRMTWSDPQEAVNALCARFAIWRRPAADKDDQTKNSSKKARRRPSGPRLPAGRRFRHRDGLTEQLVDAELFLVNPGGQTIYHLNGLAAGLWRLLDGTHGLDDVVTVLKEAFPNVASEAIEGDVKALVDDLADRGLLIEKAS
jgi:hypothetical protein